MTVRKTKGIVEVEFDEKPKIENRADALKIIDLLMKADYVGNYRLVLKAIKEAIKKGIV